MYFDIITISILLIIVCSTIIFWFIKKRILFASIILNIPLIIFITIKYVDKKYYNDLVDGIEYIDYYIFLLSLILFLVLFFEICVNILIGVKKSNGSKPLLLMGPKKQSEYAYANLLDMDIAYYDDYNDSYILNNKFKNTLGLTENNVKRIVMCQLMIPSDQEIFLNSKDSIIKFRLITREGFLWFEEKRGIEDGHVYKIIYRSDMEITTFDILCCYKDIENRINNG